jgi:2-iminoacetate synthase
VKYIDEKKINGWLERAAAPDDASLERVLERARSLQRLTQEEVAVLIAADKPHQVARLLETAACVKQEVYGRRIVLFAPLYISNVCRNACLYCAFKADNPDVVRRILSAGEIQKEVACLLASGHKRILAVAGEAAPPGRGLTDYYIEAIRAIYAVREGPHYIRRVNINCAPLSVHDFGRLKACGIGTYQLFQETYHEATYRQVHPRGPKSDPDERILAIDRAFRAGIDDIGMGVLFGLYDWRFEVLALLEHVAHLERTFGVGPHTLSVPRVEPAEGAPFTLDLPHGVSDEDFRRIVAVLRLAVPYTGMILSTRETPALRDELVALGISQISAASRTSPGGYAAQKEGACSGQFTLNDHRSLEEVVTALVSGGLLPSFCAACYRKERTGAAFMSLARPGTIKGMCQVNALITLREYLDDFAGPELKRKGYALIRRCRACLDEGTRNKLVRFFQDIDAGVRDAYV